MNWIGVPHDRDQWRVLVNTVLNLRVQLEILELAAQLAASREGFISMEFVNIGILWSALCVI
jgi:hypothetical protein